MLQAPTNKIPNYKHQITNKSQISIFNDQTFGILNFGPCDLFVIWDLLFGISTASFFAGETCQRLPASMVISTRLLEPFTHLHNAA